MPQITVVIALYNKSKYITCALDSIFNQGFEDLEVIVVDDGSTDDGAQVVKNYNDPRIKLITQANAGPGAARNTGLSYVESKYVCFFDADDEYLDGFFSNTLAFMADNLNCFGVSVDTINESNEYYQNDRLDRLDLQDVVYRVTPDFDPNKLSEILDIRGHCTWLYRTEIVKQIGGYYIKSNYGEDQYMVFQLMLLYEFGIIKLPLHKYHTELSELCGNDISDRPPMPLLTDPEPLYKKSPNEMHILIDKFLELRASGYVIRTMQSAKPNKNMARYLLNKYPYNGGNLRERTKAWTWYYAAFLMKQLRKRKYRITS